MSPTIQKHVLALTMACDLLQPLRYFRLMPRFVPCSGDVLDAVTVAFTTQAWPPRLWSLEPLNFVK